MGWKTVAGGRIIFPEFEDVEPQTVDQMCQEETVAQATLNWLCTEPPEIQEAVRQVAYNISMERRESGPL